MDSKSNSILRGAIVKTLAFFDVFQRPLAAVEIRRYLPVKATIGAVQGALAELSSPGGPVAEDSGYYRLYRGKAAFTHHQAEHRIAIGKWKIALKAARVLRLVWGVKLVAVCNNFDYKTDSDIDVFIVTKARRIWTVRALCTLALQLSGLRRHGNRVRDRACLSFYASEDGLDLSRARLADDPYFDHWLARLFPVYDAGGVYQRLIKANAWLAEKFPNLCPQGIVIRRFAFDNWLNRAVKLHQGLLLAGRPGNGLERLARGFQLKKMARNIRSASHAHDTRVVISDTMLKFHENDRRVFYREEYYKRLKDIKIER